MFVKRLELLAEHLERIAALRAAGVKLIRNFNMHFWFTDVEPHVAAVFDVECGTIACAMGEACFIREFQDLGLAITGGGPRFGGDYGIEAAARFFDIGTYTAGYLFAPNEYTRKDDPLVVANRIRALIVRGRTPNFTEEGVPLCHTARVNLISTSGMNVCPRV